MLARAIPHAKSGSYGTMPYFSKVPSREIVGGGGSEQMPAVSKSFKSLHFPLSDDQQATTADESSQNLLSASSAAPPSGSRQADREEVLVDFPETFV